MTENILEGEIISGPESSDEDTPSSKGLAKFIARTSVKFVIAGSLASIAPDAETKYQKAKLAIGTYVLADMVSRNTGAYIEEKVDAWKQDIQDVRVMAKKVYAAVKKIENASETPNQ